MLHVYAAYADGKLAESDLLRVLDMVETFILRRHVVGIPTHGLNKSFAGLFKQAGEIDAGFVTRVGELLGARDCPSDADFRERLQDARLYGGGERLKKLKLLLERLEEAAAHKETVDAEKLTIEHVMPQSLTPEWTAALGPDAEDVHDDLLHTLGNLTLTGYTSELGNMPFADKRARYADSHLELNRWFEGITQWDKDAIERRASALAERALQCWPWVGGPQPVRIARVEEQDDDDDDDDDPTGTVPSEIVIRGEAFAVRSWADVARAAAGYIVALGDEVFDRVAADQPKYLNRDATAFRRTSKLVRLSNGAYLETNLSAIGINRWSRRALERAGIRRDEWEVTAGTRPDDDEEDDIRSERRQLRLDFWTLARPALLATGAFSSLRAPVTGIWFTTGLGRVDVQQILWVSLAKNHVGTKVELRPRSIELLKKLTDEREAIEKEMGATLEWDPHPEKRSRAIRLRKDFDLSDRAVWPAAIAWLAEYGARMQRVFAPRVAVRPEE